MTTPSPFELASQISQNLGGVIERHRERTALDEILEGISEEGGTERDFDDAMGQVMKRISPQNRKEASALIEQKKNRFIQQKEQKEFNELAKKIEQDNPGSAIHKTIADIYRSNLPTKQKMEMTKNISGIIPFRLQQQKRLQQQNVLKVFNTKIKEIQEQLKTEFGPLRKVLLSDIDKLKKARDDFLGFADILGEGVEEETEELEVFNPENEEHVAIAKEILANHKGDKKKANKELAKRFK